MTNDIIEQQKLKRGDDISQDFIKEAFTQPNIDKVIDMPGGVVLLHLFPDVKDSADLKMVITDRIQFPQFFAPLHHKDTGKRWLLVGYHFGEGFVPTHDQTVVFTKVMSDIDEFLSDNQMAFHESQFDKMFNHYGAFKESVEEAIRNGNKLHGALSSSVQTHNDATTLRIKTVNLEVYALTKKHFDRFPSAPNKLWTAYFVLGEKDGLEMRFSIGSVVGDIRNLIHLETLKPIVKDLLMENFPYINWSKQVGNSFSFDITESEHDAGLNPKLVF